MPLWFRDRQHAVNITSGQAARVRQFTERQTHLPRELKACLPEYLAGGHLISREPRVFSLVAGRYAS